MNIYRAFCRALAGPERTFRVDTVDMGPARKEAYTASTSGWGGGPVIPYTAYRTVRPITARVEIAGEPHVIHAAQREDNPPYMQDTLGSDLQLLEGKTIVMRAREPYYEGTLRKLARIGL